MKDKLYNSTEAGVWYKTNGRPDLIDTIKQEIASTPIGKPVPFELSLDEKLFRRTPKDMFEALKNDLDAEVRKREWEGDRGGSYTCQELYYKGILIAIK